MKTCNFCGFYGEEAVFRKDRNQCLACRRKEHTSQAKTEVPCGECGNIIHRRASPGRDGVRRCTDCSRLRKNADSLQRMNAKAALARKTRQPKPCDLCGSLIIDKRAGPARKDGLYRCTSCQIIRNREINAVRQKAYFKGPKAEQYRETRNRGKRAWNARHPEAYRARCLILSVKARLRKYDYDFSRFQRPSTRVLAVAIANLPLECRDCGTDQDLTIEHIKTVVSHPELALEPSNLTTLCRPCNTRSYHVGT